MMVKCVILVPLVALVQLAQCCQFVSHVYCYEDYFRCQRKVFFGILCQSKFPVNHTKIHPADHLDTYLDNFKLRKYRLSQHAYSKIKYFSSQDNLESPGKVSDLLGTTFYAVVLTFGSLFVGVNAVDWNAQDNATVVSSFSKLRVYASVFLIALHCGMCVDVNPEKQGLKNPLMIDLLTSIIVVLHCDIF